MVFLALVLWLLLCLLSGLIVAVFVGRLPLLDVFVHHRVRWLLLHGLVLKSTLHLLLLLRLLLLVRLLRHSDVRVAPVS